MFIFQNGRMEFLDSGLYTWSLKTTNLEIFSTLKFVDKFLLPLEVYRTVTSKQSLLPQLDHKINLKSSVLVRSRYCIV